MTPHINAREQSQVEEQTEGGRTLGEKTCGPWNSYLEILC